jgi:hypothetical protein
MLGKFSNYANAASFSYRTEKASAIILGDDNKYWVVTMREMARLANAGYEVIK